MAAVLEHDVVVTSHDVISLYCGPQRIHLWTYYLPSKFCCHNFNILGVKRWGPNHPPPPGAPKTKKRPGLNRVKSSLKKYLFDKKVN